MSKEAIIWKISIRRNTQEAEEAPLLRVEVGKPARGFKSLFLRSIFQMIIFFTLVCKMKKSFKKLLTINDSYGIVNTRWTKNNSD